MLQCWGSLYDLPGAYMIDQIRGHWESPELLKRAALFWSQHNREGDPVGKFLVEEATAGPGLMQQLREMGIPTEGLTRVKDKAARVQDVLPYISNGLVFIPGQWNQHESWVDDFLNECAAFTQAMTHAHDDQCLVAGTMIETDHGRKPIETIKPGDRVLTRSGFRNVLKAGQTGRSDRIFQLTASNGDSIIGTGNHPVFVQESGFVNLDTIEYGMILESCESTRQPKRQTRSFSMGSPSTDTQIQSASTSGVTTRRMLNARRKASEDFTVKSGNQSTDRFPRDTRFITATRTRSIMTAQISNASRKRSTGRDIAKSGELPSNCCICPKQGSQQHLGINLQKEENGIGRMQPGLLPLLRSNRASAANVETHFNLSTRTRRSAPRSVGAAGEGKTALKSHSSAHNVVKHSSETPTGPSANAIQISVISVRRIAIIEAVPVFNLSIDGSHEYFANGILVHNCDCMVDAVQDLLGGSGGILSMYGGQ